MKKILIDFKSDNQHFSIHKFLFLLSITRTFTLNCRIRSSVSNSIMSQSDSGEECRACLKKLHKDIGHGLFEAWFTPWAVQGALIAYDLAKFADVEVSVFYDLVNNQAKYKSQIYWNTSSKCTTIPPYFCVLKGKYKT